MSASQAYPQLDNLYPAPPSSNQPSSESAPSSSRPAAGPGAGFPAKPPAPPASAGFGNYSSAGGYGGAGPSSGVYGNAGRAPGPGSGRGLGEGGEKNVAQLIVDRSNKFQRAYQTLLDRSTPLTTQRWLATGFLFFLFALIVVIAQGWYIICYALAIYLLNLFLAFLQPKFDPSIQQDLAQDDVEEGAPGLPGAGGSSSSKGGLKGLMNGFSSSSSNNNGDEEEFRPFIRRLPEFKFWLSATKATLLALLATTTRATDIPVYWPILLVYFFTLFGLTMRRQIQHMIKYRYIPFDLGRKATYGSKK
ncbi:ER to Golgi transport-related protein [Filobasidium floriforme]|uniref:ER to Golgi transport-related protein n=1 Tax=Filobasidium floriforme TaxID=5210 RepID=UPI001E8D5276|nr:ER to Golgi transport-related protein [Filobasidium floriforme]KAH8086972.1 ER to Golgi transport-related protein [Filobasidium floriforme]